MIAHRRMFVLSVLLFSSCAALPEEGDDEVGEVEQSVLSNQAIYYLSNWTPELDAAPTERFCFMTGIFGSWTDMSAGFFMETTWWNKWRLNMLRNGVNNSLTSVGVACLDWSDVQGAADRQVSMGAGWVTLPPMTTPLSSSAQLWERSALCWISGISGRMGAMPGSIAAVGVQRNATNWSLYAQTDPGVGLAADAMCARFGTGIDVKILGDYLWQRNQPSVRMVKMSEGMCMLRGFGSFGPGIWESRRIYAGSDGYWYLGGNVTDAAAGGYAYAQCIAYQPHNRVFNAGDSRVTTATGDWSPGSFKAECSPTEMVTGVSRIPGGPAHGALCSAGTGSLPQYGRWSCHNVAFAGGDNRGTTATGDWDVNAFKGECGSNEYIAGVSQSSNGQVQSILCCGTGAVTHSSCATETFENGDAREAGTSGDWDPGYFKGECGPGRYAAGLSRVMATGAPHALLCCR